MVMVASCDKHVYWLALADGHYAGCCLDLGKRRSISSSAYTNLARLVVAHLLDKPNADKNRDIYFSVLPTAAQKPLT